MILKRLARLRKVPLICILKRAVDEGMAPLITICARLGWLEAATLFFRWTIHPLSSRKTFRKPYQLLLLSKAMVTEDVLASFQDDPRYRIFSVDRNLVKALARAFLPAHVDDNNYVGLSVKDMARIRAYRRFLVLFWKKLHARRWFDAVLSGNFTYFAERELAGALEEIGLPFIVIMKESIKTPGYETFWTRIYRERRGPFTGRCILVYGESERRVEINSGVVTMDRVTVTGMPRMDLVHRRRLAAARSGRDGTPSRSVLFFMFGPKAFIPVLIRKRSLWPYTRYPETVDRRLDRLGWHRLVRETQQAVCRMAADYPDIRITIKMKGAETDKDIAAIETLMGVDRLPDNVRVVSGGDPLGLLFQHNVVCGFNSTSLLEALAAGKPVIVPRYAEAVREEMQPYIIDLGDAVQYAGTPRELTDLLVRHAREPQRPPAVLPETVCRVLDRWLFNSDGEAGRRVREAVRAEIDTSVHR